ncbi:hypothetical protein ANN_17094 [Periplaneta americana]|uniref:DUF4371 domain-containing protein n=1 Tax=Periplaneta americana TaxID=6978 RepID=A0ABQ8SRZ3_PERAM|nr:hypothetical protein ANN_17094 [Periplaneta americana]
MERPTPELNLSMDVKEKQREYTRHFTSTSYVLEYDKSKAHICSSMNFANFGNTRIDLQLDKRKALHIKQHNALVKKKNREILLHLINAVCFLGKQELAFRGHNESVESDNIGNYIEYLSSLSEFDHLLANHLESSTVFRGTSLAIQNDLIFAISGVMIKNIKPFVAIVVDETSDCSNQSQLSTVLRYVDSTANVQERFIGFTNTFNCLIQRVARLYVVCKFLTNNHYIRRVITVTHLRQSFVITSFRKCIPNLTGPVDINDVTLQRNRNKTAGRIHTKLNRYKSLEEMFSNYETVYLKDLHTNLQKCKVQLMYVDDDVDDNAKLSGAMHRHFASPRYERAKLAPAID